MRRSSMADYTAMCIFSSMYLCNMSSLISLQFSSFLQSKVGEQQQLTRSEARRHVSAGEVTNTGFSDVLLGSHTYAALAKPCWMSVSQSRWVHVWLKSSICDLPLASLGAGPRSLEPVLRDVPNLCGDDTTNVARTRGIFAISIGPKEEEEEKGHLWHKAQLSALRRHGRDNPESAVGSTWWSCF